MKLLQDAPGGATFVDSLVRSLRALALDFADQPDEQITPRLDSYIRKITPCVVVAVGAEQATQILDVFRRGVLGQKAKVEAAAASGSLAQYLEVLTE